MGVERQDADPRQRRVDPVDAWSGDRIVAARQHDEPPMRLSRHRRLDRLEGVGGRDRLKEDVARVVHAQGRQVGPRLQIVGREARQGLAQDLWSEIATARRQGPLVQRRADQGDGRTRMVPDEVRDGGPAQAVGGAHGQGLA